MNEASTTKTDRSWIWQWLIGIVAEITTPIPENGIGQIAFVAKGSRITYSARATDEQSPVERGTPVRIERIVGGMAYVSPIE